MAIREQLCMQESDLYVTGFLKSCQDGTKHQCGGGLCIKIRILHWNNWATFNAVKTCHLISVMWGTWLTEHSVCKPLLRSMIELKIIKCMCSAMWSKVYLKEKRSNDAMKLNENPWSNEMPISDEVYWTNKKPWCFISLSAIYPNWPSKRARILFRWWTNNLSRLTVFLGLMLHTWLGVSVTTSLLFIKSDKKVVFVVVDVRTSKLFTNWCTSKLS